MMELVRDILRQSNLLQFLPKDLMKDALITQGNEAIAAGTGLYLKMLRFPPGFPDGKLLANGTYRFNPHKVKEWARNQ